jgi:hypothetical protein
MTFVRLERAEGIFPVRRLRFRLRMFNVFKFWREVGIGPENEFEWR